MITLQNQFQIFGNSEREANVIFHKTPNLFWLGVGEDGENRPGSGAAWANMFHKILQHHFKTNPWNPQATKGTLKRAVGKAWKDTRTLWNETQPDEESRHPKTPELSLVVGAITDDGLEVHNIGACLLGWCQTQSGQKHWGGLGLSTPEKENTKRIITGQTPKFEHKRHSRYSADVEQMTPQGRKRHFTTQSTTNLVILSPDWNNAIDAMQLENGIADVTKNIMERGPGFLADDMRMRERTDPAKALYPRTHEQGLYALMQVLAEPKNAQT